MERETQKRRKRAKKKALSFHFVFLLIKMPTMKKGRKHAVIAVNRLVNGSGLVKWFPLIHKQ